MVEKSFAQKILDEMSGQLGENYEVLIKEVEKNNGIKLSGLLIYGKENNISPTIYLEHFEEEYREGSTIEEIGNRIRKLYQQYVPVRQMDMSFFLDFEKVKERIMYKVINAPRNETLLSEIPHICFLDLAICFYYDFYDDQIGEGTILVRNSQLMCWDTCIKELMQIARKNTGELLGIEILDMAEMLGDESEEDRNRGAILILTNQKKHFGAGVMILPGVLSGIAEKMQSSFFVLPSSVHEVIVVRDDGEDSWGSLNEIVKEVNHMYVLPEEILSENVYYYDRERGKLELLSSDFEKR